MPGKMQAGNIADWGRPNAVFTELAGQLSAGFMEGLVGYSWSAEAWGGWKELMTEYRRMIGGLAEPKVAIFAQIGSKTDYQAMRYGLASCLMDDGYYSFSSSSSYSDTPWFDEFDANLGAATSAPATTAWQNGVFRRDFENGIVLVNPKGNGVRTVNLETDFKRLSGSQASAVNNGQTGRSVTLNDRDGIILLRMNAVSLQKPAPPNSVVVQ
jgi:hypothetical protein